jgi:hypothetical protein
MRSGKRRRWRSICTLSACCLRVTCLLPAKLIVILVYFLRLSGIKSPHFLFRTCSSRFQNYTDFSSKNF